MVQLGNILIIVGIGLIVLSLLGIDPTGGFLGGNQKEVSCNVIIKNPLGSDTFQIQDASCRTTSGECTLFSIFGKDTVTNQARVSLKVDGKTKAEGDIIIAENLIPIIGADGLGQLTITGCVPEGTTSGTIEVADSQGNPTGFKQVAIN